MLIVKVNTKIIMQYTSNRMCSKMNEDTIDQVNTYFLLLGLQRKAAMIGWRETTGGHAGHRLHIEDGFIHAC